MADDIDNANAIAETLNDAAIRNIRANTKRGLKPTGFCFFCDSEVSSHLLFCNSECRQDYEQEQKIKHIQGKI